MSPGGGSSSGETQSFGSGFNTGSNVSGGANIGQGGSTGFNSASGGNESTQTNDSFGNSSQDVWGPQSGHLQGVYGGAQGLYQGQQGQLAAEGNRAGNMIGDVQQGAMGQWQDKISDGNVNAYTDQMKQSIAKDAGNASNQMMNSLDARAAGSGMSGGSRHGTAIGQGLTGINDSMLKQQANVGYQAEESARNRQMQALGQSQNMANLGMAGFNPMNAQWSGLQNYAGAVGGPTALSQSQQGSTGRTDSKGWNDSFGANESWNQNLGFNFGLGQNYGENANSSDSEKSQWNANV
ncbi:MAG: hypothetical protein DRH90_21420 [Deltaproteobacteria bacterium]|nr:MAG: hypothetical protein DRH90_21420 [Deltaproteobacteria bacterium]